MQKPEYHVNIEPADNGIIMRIGCKTLVIAEKDITVALADLQDYLTGGHKATQRLGVKYGLFSEISEGPHAYDANVPQPAVSAMTGRC